MPLTCRAMKDQWRDKAMKPGNQCGWGTHEVIEEEVLAVVLKEKIETDVNDIMKVKQDAKNTA